MSRTPSSLANLVKAKAVRESGFKTYIHSIVDEHGVQYYAKEVTELFRQGKTAKAIHRALASKYPTVDPPSLTAMNTFCSRYAMTEVPAMTMDAEKRPDAMLFMYKAMNAANAQLDMAIEMQKSQKNFPLPVVRQTAMAVIQMGEKVISAEKSIGASPVMMIDNRTTNIQNNMSVAQNVIVSDPVKGQALIESFKEFESEVLEYQRNAQENTQISKES